MAFGRIVGGDDKTLSAKLEDLPAFYRELHLIVTTPGKIIVNQESLCWGPRAYLGAQSKGIAF
jgi:hypothetical protein